VEGRVIRSNAFIRPLASDPKIRLGVEGPKYALLSPPLNELLGISNGFKDPIWRSCDEHLRQDRVVVRCELSCCHLLSRGDGLTFLSESLEPAQHRSPPDAVILRLFGLAGESCVSEFHQSSAVLAF